MKSRANTSHDTLTPALQAIANLSVKEFSQFLHNAQMVALSVHSKIGDSSAPQKSAIFYRAFLPLREGLVLLLSNSYRQYLKVGLAQSHLVGPNPYDWALGQFQPAIYAGNEWICDWYILACTGENRFIRPMESVNVAPGTTASFAIPLAAPSIPSTRSWRAPAWLFAIMPELTGIGRMKPNHIPKSDSDEELSAAHSRLILKGARRAFLCKLAALIEVVRDEETAAAATNPTRLDEQPQTSNQKKKVRRFQGVEGLGPKKADLSRYMDGLTPKQQLALSLKLEYELPPTEIASRMAIDRKTVAEHLDAATRKIKQTISNERRKSILAKSSHE